jgi:hypothetical protein
MGHSPISCGSVQVLEAYDFRQHEIMYSLRRYLIEQGLDVRTPANLGRGCEQAMYKAFGIDRPRARRIYRPQNKFDLTLGRIRAPEGMSDFAAEGFDVGSSRTGDLHFDARDSAILLLANAIFSDTACGSAILCHDGQLEARIYRNRITLSSPLVSI